jgi:hypothetical protein
MSQDLTVLIVFGDLRVQVIHEGQAGNGPLTQATVMQLAAEWPTITEDAAKHGLFDDEPEYADTEADESTDGP